MSQDGLNWARIEGEHHTGAVLDVGEEGEWDELFITNPQASLSPSSYDSFQHAGNADCHGFHVL